MTKYVQDSRRQKVAIDITFNYLNILFIKVVKQGIKLGSERKEMVEVEVLVTLNYFNDKRVGPKCQYSSPVKYIQTEQQEKTHQISCQENICRKKRERKRLRHVGEKVTEAELPGQNTL